MSQTPFDFCGPVFAALAALTCSAGAALTVSTTTVIEGNHGAPPNHAVFTLTLSPPVAANAIFEYTTSSDTARELEDYQPARGQVIIPAGQTTATVSVPLTGDSWQEGPETFSLIVWPKGISPAPTLTAISPPAGSSSAWTVRSAEISAGNWFIGNLLGERQGTSWQGLGYFNEGAAAPAGSVLSYAITSRWLGYSFTRNYNPEVPGAYAGAGYAEKDSSPPGTLPWNAPAGLTGEETRRIIMSGDIAAVEIQRGMNTIEFYQLHSGSPARLRGALHLTPVASGDNGFPGSSGVIVTGMALAGRRIAVATPLVVRIYEATGPDLAEWRQIAYLPQLALPMALEGDTLLATPTTGPETGIPCIYRKDQGGANNWGRTGVLSVPGGNFRAQSLSTTLRGGIVLIGDQLGGSTTTPSNPGRVHCFIQNSAGSSWIHSGSFTGPSPKTTDYFGSITAQAGLDFLSYEGNLEGTPGWAGSFPGATVTINDDDLPVVHLAATAVDEPTAAILFKVEARLSQSSATNVSLQWTTGGGTATAGMDYLVANGSLTIPAGQDSASIVLSILPDDEVEPTEAFSLSLTSASGAGFNPAPVSIAIRDTTRVSIVHAPARNLFEDLTPAPAQVQCFPHTKPLAFAWSIGSTGFSQGGAGPAPDFLAEPGVDWPAASGTLTAAGAGTVTFPWSVTSDALVEKSESGNVIFDLPNEAVSASFSLRHHYRSPDSNYRIERVSTDGNTVAALETGPQFSPYTLMLFLRSSSAAGGWERRALLPPAGLTAWPSSIIKLSRSRLAVYDFSAGSCWFFAEHQGGLGNWGLEAHLTGLPSGTTNYSGAEFDGETFMIPVLSSGAFTKVMLINRGDGSWNQLQTIESPGSKPFKEAHLQEGRLALNVFNGNPTSAEFLFYERSSDPVRPWEPVGSQLFVNSYTDQFRQFLLHRDLLIVSKTDTPKSTTIYRSQASGRWQLEQTIPERAAVAASRGLIQTDLGIYAEVGSSAQPWIPVMSGPVIGGIENGIFLYGANSSFGFLQISEAGLPVGIIDQDSYSVYASEDSSWLENAQSENLASISLNLQSLIRAPIDIQIPYRTIPGGTAIPGIDYRTVSGTVTLRAGDSIAYLSIPILPDAVIENPETVLVEFGPLSYGQFAGNPAGGIYTATIQDEGVSLAVPAAAGISVPEPASGSAQYLIPFRMPRPSSETFDAIVSIRGLTATAADATLAASVSIPVPAGSSMVPVPLTVLADSLVEGTEQLTVTVSLPRYSAARRLQDGPFTINVNIDDAPGARFMPDQYSVAQGQVLAPDASRNVLTNDPVPAASVEAARAPLYGGVAWQGDGTFRYTPPVNFIGTDRFAYLPSGSGTFQLPDPAPWKWLSPTNGQDPGIVTAGFQASWMQPSFNDNAWTQGNRVMGYGVLGSGTGTPLNTLLPLPASGNRFTAYFRTAFTVQGTPLPGVELEFFCDDAAIFYLNGTELGRFDNTAGSTFYTAADTYRLLSSTAVDLDEETKLRRLTVPSAQLLSGVNTLAVSVHNTSASSSDLGFRLTQLSGGPRISPVYVTIQVQDNHAVPFLTADTYTVPGTTTPINSHLIGGSLYQNDGLLDWTGLAYDPILEVERGGNPAGPVTIEKETGHFTMAAPPGFYGTTSFTYRVRDKDGWSSPASVGLTISPTRAYDVWRQAQFGGGSEALVGRPEQDADSDSLANLLEFAFNTNPYESIPSAPLTLQRMGPQWEVTFNARNSFGQDAFLTLESAASLHGTPWTPLARFNDSNFTLNRLAPGISVTDSVNGTSRQYRILLPPTPTPAEFFRLRATQERHPLDP